MPIVAYVHKIVATEGAPGRYIRVTIYDTLDDFRTAAAKTAPDLDWTDAAGAFHPSPTVEKYDRRGNLSPLPAHRTAYAGHLRLVQGHLGPEVIAHEAIHAAAHIWRAPADGRVDLGETNGPDEEDFAYLVGGITQGLTEIAESAVSA